ncbi:unnamed protein product [Leuciscus chuanchicus]
MTLVLDSSSPRTLLHSRVTQVTQNHQFPFPVRISRVHAVHLGHTGKSSIVPRYQSFIGLLNEPVFGLSVICVSTAVALKSRGTASSFMSADSALSGDLDKEAGLLLAVALERVFPDLEHVGFPEPAWKRTSLDLWQLFNHLSSVLSLSTVSFSSEDSGEDLTFFPHSEALKRDYYTPPRDIH